MLYDEILKPFTSEDVPEEGAEETETPEETKDEDEKKSTDDSEEEV